MVTYLEKVEPYMLSDESLLQRFVLGALHKSYCATEETFFKGLEANKRANHQPLTNKILPYGNRPPSVGARNEVREQVAGTKPRSQCPKVRGKLHTGTEKRV